mmetsp:Transcript_23530/g.56173  ORF Transcript_23530/g.56173 Transcript_23530/m.56173 type:complete len:346 (-) Transcript_23530:255-1292(-)
MAPAAASALGMFARRTRSSVPPYVDSCMGAKVDTRTASGSMLSITTSTHLFGQASRATHPAGDTESVTAPTTTRGTERSTSSSATSSPSVCRTSETATPAGDAASSGVSPSVIPALAIAMVTGDEDVPPMSRAGTAYCSVARRVSSHKNVVSATRVAFSIDQIRSGTASASIPGESGSVNRRVVSSIDDERRKDGSEARSVGRRRVEKDTRMSEARVTCFKFSTATVTTAPPGEHTASPGERRVTAGGRVGGATRRRGKEAAALLRTDTRTAAAPAMAAGVAKVTVARASVGVSWKERERAVSVWIAREDGSIETAISERRVSRGTFVSSTETTCPPSEYTWYGE